MLYVLKISNGFALLFFSPIGLRPELLPFIYAFCILTLLTNCALSYGKSSDMISMLHDHNTLAII